MWEKKMTSLSSLTVNVHVMSFSCRFEQHFNSACERLNHCTGTGACGTSMGECVDGGLETWMIRQIDKKDVRAFVCACTRARVCVCLCVFGVVVAQRRRHKHNSRIQRNNFHGGVRLTRSALKRHAVTVHLWIVTRYCSIPFPAAASAIGLSRRAERASEPLQSISAEHGMLYVLAEKIGHQR